MDAKYVYTKDHVKLAYQVTGSGLYLLLVHGGIGDFSKDLWKDVHWIDALKSHFTIITPDIRGNGESDISNDSLFYDIHFIMEDLNLILDTLGVKEYYYYGWSYGATIGYHMCKNNCNIIKAVCAGSVMGPQFSQEFAPTTKQRYQNLNLLKKNNLFEQSSLPKELINWAKNTDLDSRIAQLTSWETWPVVYPHEIQTKLAIYTGTNDYPDVLNELKKYEEEFHKNHIEFRLFDELDHMGLIKQKDIVIPWILNYYLK